MGDMGDIFNDLRAHRKEQRQERADKAPEQIAKLEHLGFMVRELSPHGPHLRIIESVDYWPSTGKWRFLKGRARGHGFDSLLRALNS
jgi:hypothetical protein